jgi:tRNA threonylcarbamoyladenosine biosynthesis protein TsaE
MSDLAAPSEQISIELLSTQDTERYATHLARCLSLPMVITLSGDIGAGKTTLVRALLRSLGVQGPIKSPTYSLLETYDLPQQAFLTPAQCHHFDLYRIIDESELDFIGFRDYFQANALCCIEWPERITLSPDQIDIALLLVKSEHGRTLLMQANTRTHPMLQQCVQNFNSENQR